MSAKHYCTMSVLAGLFILVCSPTQPEIHSYPGMRYISAKSHYFTMGSGDRWAGNEEKPPMRVGFSYDFWIDTAEVTVEFYYRVMNRLPPGYKKEDSTSDKPAGTLSWYDAVLFCNQRSVYEGLDTVYAYSSYDLTAEGRVFRMNAMKTDLNRTGYRLPTEAEWEYAAHGGNFSVFPWGDSPDSARAQSIAWFGLNAGNSSRPVCGLAPNGFALYDMFGNVMEWVNDYMGRFDADTVVNFTGPDFNSRDERPVKGGGYVHTMGKLRASSRMDEYATLSSTVRPYIGMRCCLGAIPFRAGVTPATPDSANPVQITNASVASLLPTRNAKLVFVNITNDNRHLCYCDFNENGPQIYCLTDFSPVYAPTVSPDGRWVAFCTQDEGSRDNSAIYLRRLDAVGSRLHKLEDVPAFFPRWWVDTLSGDVFLVYTNSAVDNQFAEWNATSTRLQQIINGMAVGAPQTLEAHGGYHGGLSADKRFLASGSSRLRMKDLLTGETKVLFTSPQNGKTVDDTSQVCNVSIAPNSRVLFLDFGTGRSSSSVVGSAYHSHEIIFMSDFSGDVLSWYRCPATGFAWDFPEWSSHPDHAVATVKPITAPQQNREIHLINLPAKTTAKIIEGVELAHPSLWMFSLADKYPLLATDSLGYYNEPPTDPPQRDFAQKMAGFWSCHDSIEVLCCGSSRLENGIVPQLLEPNFVYNFGFASGGLLASKNILDTYARYHCPRLTTVIISIDLGWFNEPQGDIAWMDLSGSKGYRYDVSHEFWKTGLPTGFMRIVKAADNPYDEVMAQSRGWLPMAANGWANDSLYQYLFSIYMKDWIWEVNDTCLSNLELLELMVADLQERNLQVIGIVFPMSPEYQKTPVFGILGPTHAAARQLLDKIAEIDATYPAFHLYDVHNYGKHGYTDADAANEGHLSEAGAKKLTTWLKPILDTLIR